MPHTPEQRNRHALCEAKKKNGDKCRLFAGQGTSHSGVGRCKYHLGNSKNHEAHAVRVEATWRLVEFGDHLQIGVFAVPGVASCGIAAPATPGVMAWALFAETITRVVPVLRCLK